MKSRLKPLFLFYADDRNEANLTDVAETIVLLGSAAIAKFPRAIFGPVSWVDPREVEAYRHVAALVGEYLKRETANRPLSFAVFGPPGSGKSFGVKRVAETLGMTSQTPLQFNLSQSGDLPLASSLPSINSGSQPSRGKSLSFSSTSSTRCSVIQPLG